jgi:maltose alpha-D-glucosyltransferase/alpha-amylase
VIDSGVFAYQHVNAAQQRRDPNSLLNWTERIIRMRKEVPEIGWGDFQIVKTPDVAVLAIRYDWQNNSVFFVHNLASTPREVSISLGLAAPKHQMLINLLSDDHSRPEANGKHKLMLEAYGYRWFRVGGLDYLLVRSAVEDDTPKRRARSR